MPILPRFGVRLKAVQATFPDNNFTYCAAKNPLNSSHPLHKRNTPGALTTVRVSGIFDAPCSGCALAVMPTRTSAHARNDDFAKEKVMKATFWLVLVSVLVTGMVEVVGAQNPEVTHNTWTSGTPMPTARMGAAAAAVGTNIYVIGGYYVNDITGVNEIYNTKTNKWTTGAPDPATRAFVAYAVVNKILYVFGGSNGSELLNVTESYDPATDTWTTLAPVPYVAETAAAVADKDVIYVIGGQDSSGYVTNVASYNTTTNTWTEETPLMVPTGWEAVGLLGATVVAADGGNSSSYVGSEGYNVKKNTWVDLPADPTPRLVGCYAVIKGKLYLAGGNNGSNLTLNESYNPKTKSWTTLAPMPEGIQTNAASAEAGGRLFCFGGGLFDQIVYNNVQIYQP